MGSGPSKTKPGGPWAKADNIMHVSRVGRYKWYQSRLSTSSSVGPLPWSGVSGRVSMWAGQEGWQATAQGRAA